MDNVPATTTDQAAEPLPVTEPPLTDHLISPPKQTGKKLIIFIPLVLFLEVIVVLVFFFMRQNTQPILPPINQQSELPPTATPTPVDETATWSTYTDTTSRFS